MKVAAVLAAWTARRIRFKCRLWFQVFRMYSDWVTALYVLVPGLGFLAWWLVHYYRMSLGWAVFADQVAAFGLTFRVIMAAVTIAALAVLDMSSFDRPAIALESGDRLFVMLSPLRRSWLAVGLWAEGVIFTLPVLGLAGVLLFPLERMCGVHAATWFGFLAVTAGCEAMVRAARPLGRSRDGGRWKQVIFSGASLVPGAGTALALYGRPGAGWLVILLGCGLISLLAYRHVARTEWEGLFRERRSLLLSKLLPDDGDPPARTGLGFHRLPPVVLGFAENTVRRRVHPVVWIIVLRALRRKGTLRDVSFLTLVAVRSLLVAPSLWIKLIYLGFCALLFSQWWRMYVVPLYETAVQRQHVVDPGRLTRAASRCRNWAVVGSCAVWLLIWAFFGALGDVLPRR